MLCFRFFAATSNKEEEEKNKLLANRGRKGAPCYPMIPPVCTVCGLKRMHAPAVAKPFNYLQFALTRSGRKFDEQVAKNRDFCGAHPDKQWFCALHASRARDLAERGYQLNDAVRTMRG